MSTDGSFGDGFRFESWGDQLSILGFNRFSWDCDANEVRDLEFTMISMAKGMLCDSGNALGKAERLLHAVEEKKVVLNSSRDADNLIERLKKEIVVLKKIEAERVPKMPINERCYSFGVTDYFKCESPEEVQALQDTVVRLSYRTNGFEHSNDIYDMGGLDKLLDAINAGKLEFSSESAKHSLTKLLEMVLAKQKELDGKSAEVRGDVQKVLQ